MRLHSLEIDGFRGFPRRQSFDLNADAIVLIGANGHGKTSFFDAILWALCGKIPRLKTDDTRLISIYSESGQARVVLRLMDPDGNRQFAVTRTFDGIETKLALETPDGHLLGPAAEGRLIDLIWPSAASASDTRDALASVLTRSVYLQQDLIREFVEVVTDQDRFTTVSELVGAGRVTELQGNLERAKKAWSTATNQRQDELRVIQARSSLVDARLTELSIRSAQGLPSVDTETWGTWRLRLSDLGIKIALSDPSSREAPSSLDIALKQLDTQRRVFERRAHSLSAIRSELAMISSAPVIAGAPLHERAAELKKKLEVAKQKVAEEQGRLAESHRNQAALVEKTQQVQALASLALRHLDDRCPVCDQTIDKEATRRRLEAIVQQVGGPPADNVSDKLQELLKDVAILDVELSTAELSAQSADRTLVERKEESAAVARRLGEIGIAGDDIERDAALAKAVVETERAIQASVKCQKEGESLALRLAQTSAAAAKEELRRELETLKRESTDKEAAIAERNQTGTRAQAVIEALREAGSAVVEERLRDLGPLLQGIYTRIDPHPAFRLISFLSSVVRGRGQLSTILRDPVEQKESDLPLAVLSSSQLNALAVSVFFAFSLGAGKPPLPVVMLDDPLQSLDDIHLLGLVDLLRRSKDRRQLCVSTHDARFGELLSRKLRPSGDKGRTVVIELDGWTRQGPNVFQRDVKCDPAPLRLAAS